MITTSIFKDTFYTVSATASPFTYTLSVEDGTVEINGVQQPNIVEVFNGKAWAAPSSTSLEISINSIAQDYLKTDMMDLREISATTAYTHDKAFRTFYLYNSNSVLLETYRFLLDWSYNEKDLTSAVDLSNPINGKYSTNMLMFSTIFNTSAVTTTISLSPSAVTDCNGNALYTDYSCNGEWALYYLNRNAGWDSLIIQGMVTKKDSYEKYYIDNAFDNNTIDFGKRTYHNQITPSWELHTGWLKDSESDNLAFNLLSSNQVYLHNLKDDEIYPVILTDAETTYKTFRNQNNKMYNYTINVQSSQLRQNIG